MASHFGAAVIGELAGRAVSKVLATLGDRSGVDEKLRRLKMLVIKLHSTVEVSEKLGTETASLLEWREKLKEAATEGQQVLLSFQKRAPPEPEADAATEAANKGHRQGESESTSGAMSLTRSALEGVATSVRNATALLLTGDEGAGNLNSTLDKLEKVYTDVGEFIRLLQVEALTLKTVERPNKRKLIEVETVLELTECGDLTEDIPHNKRARVSTELEDDEDCGVREHVELEEQYVRRGQEAGTDIFEDFWCFTEQDYMSEEPDTAPTSMEVPKDALAKERAWSTAVEGLEDASATEEDGLAEEPAMTAALKRLNDAVAEISRAVEMADGRDLSNLESLAEWADVLREEKQRGHAILQVVRDTKAHNQAEEGHGEDLLYSATESLENLALDVGWFTSLVSLCTPI